MPLPVEIPMSLLTHAVEAPYYATSGAAGADLMAAVAEDAPLSLEPGAIAAVPTGVSLALPPGWEAQVRPRSGLARRHGVTVLNAPGTIDWDFRGEIEVLLINHGPAVWTVERGMRIAQLIVCPVRQAQWVLVESLDETARGVQGFGSTGADSDPPRVAEK
ncbi:MAG: dUTP diphosphatase [Rhodobacteraceae bacterium]|nr:dUTP diphosphatase [Paracoccaceae bacterium]